ncbi:hypothetical protein ABW20_dc0101475 [Dactylellina cionopaga]|nr:hypothetical protein ABW20_dc0101475 [Dactylellina cionopaga]
MAALLYYTGITYNSESSGWTAPVKQVTERPTVSGAENLTVSRHLTQEECLATYPGLFVEADRAAEFWRKKGGITLNHVDKAMTASTRDLARVVIRDGEMYVKHKSDGWQTRVHSTLAMIYEATLTSREPIPDIEFAIFCADHLDNSDSDVPVLALDRIDEEEHLWLMPDFGFNSWPEPKVGTFSEVKRKASEFDATNPWETKIPKLFWKGALLVEIRKSFFELAKNWDWAQVEEIDWKNKDTVMTMDAHCGFKYLVHLEGAAYSGRLKYLMMCRSVVMTHELEFIQHFHPIMNSNPSSPDQNLVVIPGRKWKTLPETMQYLIDNDKAAEEFADRSSKFWKHYLSKASVDCYWRYLFQKYAEVQKFTPEVNYNMTPYASFALMGVTEWDPH